MDAENLVLAVMTVDRDPPYVHQTLASLFACDPMVHDVSPVHVVVGTSNTKYVQNYQHHRAISLHPLDQAEQDRIAGWSPHRRFCHNYVRCLSLPIPEAGGICVCEDDVIFRDLFVQRLLKAIRELEENVKERDYCLALFTDCDLEQNTSFYRGRFYCSYGWPFHGTQCMYYPAAVAATLRDYIQQRGVDRQEDCGDLLVGRLYGDRMYASPRSLVDHVGEVSTGLGGAPRSPTFRRPYRPIEQDQWGKGD
jgi:hypothetical protein